MQVKMTDMQVRGTPRDMLSGDPHCAPLPAVLAEAYISLLRKLIITDTWSRQVDGFVPSCIFDFVILI
jgi:E3 ubiquitin-protein ligase HERC1